MMHTMCMHTEIITSCHHGARVVTSGRKVSGLVQVLILSHVYANFERGRPGALVHCAIQTSL